MPDYFKAEQAIRQNLPAADVVHKERAQAVRRFFINDYADMRNASAQIPAYNVARLVVVRILGDG